MFLIFFFIIIQSDKKLQFHFSLKWHKNGFFKCTEERQRGVKGWGKGKMEKVQVLEKDIITWTSAE